jgi:hypothetical protein
MKIPPELVPAIGPISAAVVAGSIAFLASVFTKEGKTSEFRQAWIDGLRNDIAEFVSAFYWLSDQAPLIEGDTDEGLKQLKEEFLKAELMQARIELRINPKEHADFVKALRGLVRIESFTFGESESRDAAVEEFVVQSQKLLKKEWKRVKRGEPAYFLTKWLSLLLVACAVGFGGYLVLQGNQADPGPPSNNSSKPTPLRGAA